MQKGQAKLSPPAPLASACACSRAKGRYRNGKVLSPRGGERIIKQLRAGEGQGKNGRRHLDSISQLATPANREFAIEIMHHAATVPAHRQDSWCAAQGSAEFVEGGHIFAGQGNPWPGVPVTIFFRGLGEQSSWSGKDKGFPGFVPAREARRRAASPARRGCSAG